MADNAIAENGVYYDTQTSTVVHERPSEGIQLVPPGGEITGNRQRVIDDYELATSKEAAKARAAEVEAAQSDVVETATEPGVETATVDTKTVDTATAAPKRATKAAKSVKPSPAKRATKAAKKAK